MRSCFKPLGIAAVAWSLLGAGCGKHQSEPMLHDRIVAANTAQYCHLPDACFKPNVLAYEDGYFVTVFLDGKFQHAQVPVKDLARYLQHLPMQAWPLGPSIGVTRSDDVFDEQAVVRNFEAAQRICRSLGLNVEIRLAG